MTTKNAATLSSSAENLLVSGAIAVVVFRVVKDVLRAEKQASNGKYHGENSQNQLNVHIYQQCKQQYQVLN